MTVPDANPPVVPMTSTLSAICQPETVVPAAAEAVREAATQMSVTCTDCKRKHNTWCAAGHGVDGVALCARLRRAIGPPTCVCQLGLTCPAQVRRYMGANDCSNTTRYLA